MKLIVGVIGWAVIRSLFQFENLKYNAGFALLDLGNYIAHAVVIIESFISNKFTQKNNQLQWLNKILSLIIIQKTKQENWLVQSIDVKK